MQIRNLVAKCISALRSKLGSMLKTRKIYLSLCRLRPRTRHVTVSKDTEIVIEGYPRSANTFAVAAFTYAQQRPVKIARHLHAPAQVIAGVGLVLKWRDRPPPVVLHF